MELRSDERAISLSDAEDSSIAHHTLRGIEDDGAIDSEPLASLKLLLQGGMLDAVLSAATDYIYLVDREGYFLYVGQAGANALGFAPQQMVGKTGRQLGLPDPLMDLAERVRTTVFATGRPVRGRTLFPTVDGLHEFQYTYSPLTDTNGNVHYVVGVAHDIAAFVEVERQLREAADQLQLITDTTPLLITYVDTELRFRFVNRAYAEWFGRPAEEIIGRTVRETVGEERYPDMIGYLQTVLTGQHVSFDLTTRHRDGTLRVLHCELAPDFTTDTSGGRHVRGYVGVTSDITARRQSEQRLQENEERYRSLFEHNPDAVYSFDLTGRFDAANTACEQLTGYTAQELQEVSFLKLVVPEDRERALHHFAQALQGHRQKYDVAIAHRDGHRVELSATKIPIVVSGHVVGVYGIAKDITERKVTAEALRQQAEEMALLYETGRRIGQTLDLKMVYDTFRQMVTRAMDCDAVFVSEFDAASVEIRGVYSWMAGESLDSATLPTLPLDPDGGKGLHSQVVRSGDSILVNDFPAYLRDHDLSYYPDRHADPDGSLPLVTQSLLMVPIRIEDRVVGAVQVQSERKGAYSLAQMRLLEAMTLQVAAASRNAYLFSQLERAAQQQRKFLREMLSGLTEGRLRLCDSEADLPPPLPFVSPSVQLSIHTVRDLRAEASAIAEQLAFSPARTYDLKTAVGESAMNAVIHAGGGEGEVRFSDPERGLIQVWIRDAGQGIATDSLHRATLERGYSSAGTLGHGFGLVLAMADRVYLLTGTGGTTVVLEQDRVVPEPIWR